MADDAAPGFHPRTLVFIEEMQRYAHRQFLRFADPLKIDMQKTGLIGMTLQILQHDLFAAAVQLDSQDVREEGLMFELMHQIVMHQRYHGGFFVGTIKDTGNLTRTAQAAARTFPYIRTRLGIELKTLHCVTP